MQKLINDLPLLFDLVEKLKGHEARSDFHPEKCIFSHSIQTMEWAFRESNDLDLILAAMLHDIGKTDNTLGHERIAVEWLTGLVSEKVLWLIEHHLRIKYYMSGEMKKLSKCIELVSHKYFLGLVQLARWDQLGRNPNKKISFDRDKITDRLLSLSKSAIGSK